MRTLSIYISNVRRQGCDNGSNMKGKHEGVKKDILYIILEHYTHHMIVIALT